MDTITVGVRLRPLVNDETGEIKWTVKEKSVCPIDSSACYEFDNVFGQEVVTETIFNEVGRPVVSDAVGGINGTIFAYGQTASGKTYTMMGDEDSLGIIPLAVLNLYKIIEKHTVREFIVRVSYFELYNESITDLQNTSKTNLQLREGPGRLIVHNLTETECCSVSDVLRVLVAGRNNRTVRETKMNTASSRSHAVFTIIIESKDLKQDNEIVQVSCLNLVDLAGSEKASAAINQTEFKEGRSINLSLMTLTSVISKLSVKNYDGHIQYRDSKLTRYLRHSLGGNSKTVIICNISPLALEESHSTLKFAQRAKKISNKPFVNEVFLSERAMQRKIAKLTEELNLMTAENKRLKKGLNSNDERPEDDAVAMDTPSSFVADKQLVLDSPLFNKHRSFISTTPTATPSAMPTPTSSVPCRTFILPNVTYRRKKPSRIDSTSEPQLLLPLLFDDFNADASTQTEATPIADIDPEATVQAISDISGCMYTNMDTSFRCPHYSELKIKESKLEELQFKFDENEITLQEVESTLSAEIDGLKSEVISDNEMYNINVKELKDSMERQALQFELEIKINEERHQNELKELNELLSNKNAALETEVSLLRQHLIEAEDKFFIKSKEIEEMRLEMNTKDNEISSLSHKIQQLKDTECSITKELIEIKTDMTATVTAKDNEISSLSHKTQQLKESEDRLLVKFKEIETENAAMKESVKKTNELAFRYRTERNIFRGKYEEMKSENTGQTMKEQETESVELECSKLKSEIARLQEELCESTQKLTEQEAAVAEKEDNIAIVLAENKSLLKRNLELINNRVSKDALSECEMKCLRLKEELFQLNKAHEKLKQDIARVRKERNIFRTKYEEVKDKVPSAPPTTAGVPVAKQPDTPKVLDCSRFSYIPKEPTAPIEGLVPPTKGLAPPTTTASQATPLATALSATNRSSEPVKPVHTIDKDITNKNNIFATRYEGPGPSDIHDNPCLQQ